ncbi:uncharacterized protein LOC119332683 [Triticum dicoccoides]|uniref:uncharacterized protein LOC119332683 n=1 Tax=Triticum dicoccoides TaxID=85692 RepID=UPI001890F3FB|nr:uncharacterized protein LOC119332683 [Triticum dicoccoides]
MAPAGTSSPPPEPCLAVSTAHCQELVPVGLTPHPMVVLPSFVAGSTTAAPYLFLLLEEIPQRRSSLLLVKPTTAGGLTGYQGPCLVRPRKDTSALLPEQDEHLQAASRSVQDRGRTRAARPLTAALLVAQIHCGPARPGRPIALVGLALTSLSAKAQSPCLAAALAHQP